jgi:hypothetical protein
MGVEYLKLLFESIYANSPALKKEQNVSNKKIMLGIVSSFCFLLSNQAHQTRHTNRKKSAAIVLLRFTSRRNVKSWKNYA